MKKVKFSMIAGIYENKNIIGYRLLKQDDKSHYNISIADTIKILKSQNMAIVNLKLSRDAIKYPCGDIARYPRITDSGILIDENGNPSNLPSSLTLITEVKIGDKSGYEVSNYKGDIKNLSDDDIINYGERYGIANGKIVNRDGVKIISAISGTFDIVDYTAELEARKAKRLEDENKAKEPEKEEPKKTEPVTPVIEKKAVTVYPEYHREDKLTDFDKYILALCNIFTNEDDIRPAGYYSSSNFDSACKAVNNDYNTTGTIRQESKAELIQQLAKMGDADFINKIYNKHYRVGYTSNVNYCLNFVVVKEIANRVINITGNETIENADLFKLINIIPCIVGLYNATNQAFDKITVNMLNKLAAENESLDTNEKIILSINIPRAELTEKLSGNISLKDILNLDNNIEQIKKSVNTIIDKIEESRITGGVKIREAHNVSGIFNDYMNRGYSPVETAIKLIDLLEKDSLVCSARAEEKKEAFAKIVNNKETYLTICDTVLLSNGNVTQYIKNVIELAYKTISDNMKG